MLNLKKKIRREIFFKRKKKNILYEDAPQLAAKYFFFNVQLNQKNIVGLYWPINYELDTRPLIKLLLLREIKIALPFFKKNMMIFKLWKNQEPLTFTKYKIYSPSESNRSVFPDFLVVPCLAFDNLGNRLGYGSGHYDKYLEIHKKTKCVGFSYSFQHFKSLPNETHDLKLDYIVTEKFFRKVVR